jgi:hypothetical protein
VASFPHWGFDATQISAICKSCHIHHSESALTFGLTPAPLTLSFPLSPSLSLTFEHTPLVCVGEYIRTRDVYTCFLLFYLNTVEYSKLPLISQLEAKSILTDF